jgi:tetratricopeptide (TPR) repeat protein
MIILKLVFGVFFIFIGWVYLYKSNMVLTLNRIVRETFFNDRLVLLERKKVAIFFFCLSFVALFMGFSSLALWNRNNGVMETDKYLMYMAMQDYCTERYENAIDKYKKVLKYEPNNVEAWKRMAYTYMALGEKKKARAIWKKLLTISPSENDAKEISEKLNTIAK